MISAYLPSGSKIGVGYQAHALANELALRGHDVVMFSRSGASEGAVYETPDDSGAGVGSDVQVRLRVDTT